MGPARGPGRQAGVSGAPGTSKDQSAPPDLHARAHRDAGGRRCRVRTTRRHSPGRSLCLFSL